MQRNCFICCTAFLLMILSNTTHATEWRECEQAKLRQLNLQQARREASPSKRRKSSHSGSKQTHGNAEQIDDWLWKNCREYSYELRTLEQQRM